jgi:nucleotide-binding universal stress UspA family protein
MIILAHDGSVCGDWVSRYAICFSDAEPDRRLLALHVLDGKSNPEIIRAKFERLKQECQNFGIDFISQFIPLGKSVHRSLRQAVPHDPQALLICGTRIKPTRNAFLRGSVAERLLRMHQCPVLALRVVQPGLLGSPRSLLLPLAGHSGGLARVWPILQRLLPHLSSVQLLRVIQIHSSRESHLTQSAGRTLRHEAQLYLDRICTELTENIQEPAFQLDRRVTLAPGWPIDVLTHASRLKVQMMLLGVSERSLAHRVLHGVGLERVLLDTPCDVGIYRGL